MRLTSELTYPATATFVPLGSLFDSRMTLLVASHACKIQQLSRSAALSGLVHSDRRFGSK